MLLLIGIMLIITTPVTYAEYKEFHGHGEYILSDYDKVSDAEKKAVEYAKSNAVEQAGVFISSTSLVNNSNLIKDDINVYIADNVKVVSSNTKNLILDRGSVGISADVIVQVDMNIFKKSEQDIYTYVKMKEIDDILLKPAYPMMDMYLLKEGYDKIISILSDIIDKYPNHYNAYNNRGVMYKLKGNYDAALNDYNKAIQLKGDKSVFYINRAALYWNKKLYDNALSDLNKSVGLNNCGSYPYYMRAWFYIDQEKYDEALLDIEQCLLDEKCYYNALFLKGELYRLKGDKKSAIELYNKSINDLGIRIDGMYLLARKAYMSRSKIYHDSGKFDKENEDIKDAMFFYNMEVPVFSFVDSYENGCFLDHVVEIGGFDDYANLNLILATNEYFAGSIEKAKEDLMQLEKSGIMSWMKNKDLRSNIYFWIGLIMLDQENIARSIDYFNLSINDNKQNYDARVRRAKSYYSINETEKALEDIQEAIKINPDKSDAYMIKGEMFLKSNDFNSSVKEFTTAINKGDESFESYMFRAHIYIMMSEYELAIKDIDTYLNNKNPTAIAYRNRAKANYELYNYNESLNDCNKGLEIDPNNKDIILMRAAVYIQLGNDKLALEDYEKIK